MARTGLTPRKSRKRSTANAAIQKKALKKKRAQQRARNKEIQLARARADLAAAPGRIVAAVARGDYKAAITDQALVLASNKNDPKAWQDFSTYLEKAGRLDDAATAIARAAQIGGGDASGEVSALYQRDALAKAGKGDFKAAIAQQAMAIKERKNDPRLWREMGDYMQKAGRLDNAATALRRAYRLGGGDPEEEIFQMYQSDVFSRAETLSSDQRIAVYRSHLERYSDVRGNPVRQRLAQELKKQSRVDQARDVDLQIAKFDLRDAVAAERSTVSQLEDAQRDTQTALADIKPGPATGSGGLGADLGEISGTLIDALEQIEALQESLGTKQPPPGQTFEVVVPNEKPGKPKTVVEQPPTSKPQGPGVGGVEKTARAPTLTPPQKQLQLDAAREQWKVIQFHYKNAKQARAKAQTMTNPAMKRYYTRLAEENISWAQGMIQKLNTTLTGQTARDLRAASALNPQKIDPIKTTSGKAFEQAQHLAGQGADGKKGTARNIIDGSNKPIYKLPPDGQKPKVQELLGVKQPPRNAPAN